MSRVPSPPPRDLDDRPTIAGSTLGFSAALTFAVLGGVVFLPWAVDRCGEPEVIEAQALGDAQRSLSRFVLVGTTAGVIALFALSSA